VTPTVLILPVVATSCRTSLLERVQKMAYRNGG